MLFGVDSAFDYLNQDGVVEHNNYTKYNIRLNLTSKINKHLTMTARLQGSYATVKEPNVAGSIDGSGLLVGIIQQGLRFPGFRPSTLSDGTWGPGVKGFGTAKAWLASKSFIKNPTARLQSNIRFDYKPINELKFSLLGAFNYTHQQTKAYKATLPITIDGKSMKLGPSTLNQTSGGTKYTSLQAIAEYNKTFLEVHKLNFLAGYSWEEQDYRNLQASRDNFPGNDLPYLVSGSPDNQLNSGGGYDWALQSIFGRLQYNYKERYLFESTVRYDGSSRFPTNEQYGLFPSAAIGWRISEESFMKENADLSFIDNLKLKTSFGILGNNNIGNYPYQSTYGLGNQYNYSFGGNIQQGANMMYYNDPNLKWETTRTIDGGIELSLWQGLLNIDASYFYRKTFDILYKANASVSAIFGLRPKETNTGELSNRGWEFNISHKNTIGKVKYTVGGNFSIIKNKVETLGIGNIEQLNGMVGNGSNLFIGYPMQMYYGYKTDGVFLDQTDIDAWYQHTDQSKMGASQAKTLPGDIRYKDISGPDGVPDGKITSAYDKVYLGSRIPKYTFGLSLSAEYNNFDFNVLLQGVSGVKGMLGNYAGWALWSEGNIQKWQADGAFNEENPTRHPAYPRIRNLGNSIGINNQTSDFWVRDASYIRIKNLQLGYTLPKIWFTNGAITNVRIYAAAENLLTFSGYPQGWDPETNSNGPYYPFLSTYTFGVNIKF